MSDMQDATAESEPTTPDKDVVIHVVPSIPVIVVAEEPWSEADLKRKELQELDERLLIRVGQIERAENRLLSLQNQLLGLSTIEERLVPAYSGTSTSSEVFRVDASSEEPLRIKTTSLSSPRSEKSGFLSHSANTLAPTPQRGLFASDSNLGHGNGLNASASTPKSEQISSGTPFLTVGAPSTPGLSPMGHTRSKSSFFNIRSSGSVYNSDGEKSDRFGFSSSSSSGSSTLSFTLLKSLFGSSDEKPIVSIKIDASQIRICERVPQLCTSDFEIFRANIGGWGCNVKMINLGRTEANDARFFKRIKLLEALPTHPNIARYYFHDIDGEGTCCRIYTEWFQTNLADVIERRREARGEAEPFSAQEIEFVLMEVVKGIEFLHSYSILHRTISPSNIQILLDDEGHITRVAIANLDLAKVITDRVNARGSAMHDPRYCAPEVITAKKTGAYSFPSDIWSLGLIAFSLLTFKRPWDDENDPVQLASLITSGNRPTLQVSESVATHGAEFAPFVEIFNECTRVRPDDRPTVSIIKQALITKASIAEHRRATQLNIGFTYQPKREASAFFERFLVAGVPIGFRKPESAQPIILYQYPEHSTMPVAYKEILLNFCIAQSRPSVRIKRTHSMSNVNQKLFASRDMTEHSASASIFTMMEGEELRYGVCVYFEEPVDIVPSFMSTQRVLEDAKKDTTAVDWKRISKSTTNLSTIPTKRTKLSPLPASVEANITRAAPNPATSATQRGLLSENPRRRHQRTASDGSAFKLAAELAKAGDVEVPSHSANHSSTAHAAPMSMGHVKFTHRCYVLFSKWPFFKLHFEVLWALLAQERLARISAPETKIRPPASTAPSQPTPALNASLPESGSPPAAAAESRSSTTAPLKIMPAKTAISDVGDATSQASAPIPSSSPSNTQLGPHSPTSASNMRSKARSVSMAPAMSSSPPAPSPALHVAATQGSSSNGSGDLSIVALTIPLATIEEVDPSAVSSSPPNASVTPRKRKTSNPKRMTVSISTDVKVAATGGNKAEKPEMGTSVPASVIAAAMAEPEPTEDNCMVLRMLGSYYRTPVPTEKHQTTLVLAHHSPILYTPGDVTEAVAEWCFPGMFRTLSVKTLVKLFTAVLLEEKIVMVCADTGVLTSCVTGLTAMLRPYAWQGTFLPILPESMMDVLDSPIPFVAGVPSASAPRHVLDDFDGIVVDLHHDTITGRSSFPRLPSSDRIYDAFGAYASAVAATGISSNPCKSCPSDADALSKLLAAFALWHSNLLEHLAAIPSVGLDFKWGNNKDVETVIRALSSSERDFYREFVETQHFSIISDRLNTIICQIRARKDHQKDVQKLENIFTSN